MHSLEDLVNKVRKFFRLRVNLGTVLPHLVRRRTVKLMRFFDKKKSLILSNFLRFMSFFSRKTLI